MSDLLLAAAPGAAVFGTSGVGVLLSGKRAYVERWLSWLGFATVVFVAASTGVRGTAAFAVLAALVCGWEYARLAGLPAPDRALLIGAVAAAPLVVAVAGSDPRVLTLLIAGGLLAALLGPLVHADADDGFQRAARTAFGLAWLAVPLTMAAGLGAHLLPLVAAVSFADVAAYAGGHTLGRHGRLSRKLSALSPNKTWAGVLTGGVTAAAVLLALDAWSWPTLAAVVVGGVGGDLVESMVKRGVGVKDAGAWLPGFGGLLDRLDSLLGALVVLAVLAGAGVAVVA